MCDIIAFPLQQMMPERASILRYTFIACILILRCVIPVVCWKTNGELISVRKRNYNCMLDDGIY